MKSLYLISCSHLQSVLTCTSCAIWLPPRPAWGLSALSLSPAKHRCTHELAFRSKTLPFLSSSVAIMTPLGEVSRGLLSQSEHRARSLLYGQSHGLATFGFSLWGSGLLGGSMPCSLTAQMDSYKCTPGRVDLSPSR